MADVNTSPNMSLPVPITGTTSGPEWANDIVNCLTIIDQHNHASGSGVPINPDGININSDLPFNNNNLTSAKSLRLQAQSAPLGGASDLGCLYESGVDLYYNDGNGNQVRITQSGNVAGTPGSIANLTSPASASYVSANQTFVWQSAASTPANLDAASIILRNLSANSKGLTLSPPAAMGSDYNIVLPSLPGTTNILTIDSSGNIGSALNVDNSTLQISTNVLSIKNSGVSTAQLADQGVTQAKLALRPSASVAAAGQIAVAGNAGVTTCNGTQTTVVSVTLTTTGRPVNIICADDNTGTTSNFAIQATVNTAQTYLGKIQIYRGVSKIAEQSFGGFASGAAGNVVVAVPTKSFGHLDYDLAAGTYVYTLKVQSPSTDVTILAQYLNLIAYEI